MVNGTLYFSAPDHVWAVDARTGREIWHYFWKTRGGIHIGNRGVGMSATGSTSSTPDNYFVSLDAATGKERWHHEIANVKREYFSTNAPMIVGKQVHHRRRRRRARRPGLPGVARSREAAMWSGAGTRRRGRASPAPRLAGSRTRCPHGGGMPWLPGTYDPELNLYYHRHRQPAAACWRARAGAGDNLCTCSIVALNPITGKMAWYYQVSPHDTHDWDAAQTPILIDGVFGGTAAQAAGAGEPQRPLLRPRSRRTASIC